MTTATLDISEARRQISSLVDRLRDDRVIWVTKHSKRAFAVVEPETMQALIETLEILADPETFKMLQQSIEDIKMGRLHDHEDVKRDLLR